jgi:hypothetical protein
MTRLEHPARHPNTAPMPASLQALNEVIDAHNQLVDVVNRLVEANAGWRTMDEWRYEATVSDDTTIDGTIEIRDSAHRLTWIPTKPLDTEQNAWGIAACDCGWNSYHADAQTAVDAYAAHLTDDDDPPLNAHGEPA